MTQRADGVFRPFSGGANIHTIHDFPPEHAGGLSPEEMAKLLEMTAKIQTQGSNLLAQSADNLAAVREGRDKLQANNLLIDTATDSLKESQVGVERVLKTMIVVMISLAFLALYLFLFNSAL